MADVLIRLPSINSDIKESNITRGNVSESYSVDKLDIDTFPLTYQNIDKYQHKDKNMVGKLKLAKYHTKYFCGGGNTFIIIY